MVLFQRGSLPALPQGIRDWTWDLVHAKHLFCHWATEPSQLQGETETSPFGMKGDYAVLMHVITHGIAEPCVDRYASKLNASLLGRKSHCVSYSSEICIGLLPYLSLFPFTRKHFIFKVPGSRNDVTCWNKLQFFFVPHGIILTRKQFFQGNATPHLPPSPAMSALSTG